MIMNILTKIPAVLVMAGIFVLSSLPGDDLLLNTFEFSDKIKHLIAYFVLGITSCLWISSKSWLAKPVFWCVIVVVVCAVFAISDEYHQSFVPGRSGNDFGDLIADFIGGFVSVFLYLFFVLKHQRLVKRI
jgi:VanZ family protein